MWPIAFGNPGVLWGLPLVALPLLLQLVRQSELPIVHWGAMRFLEQAVTRNQARLRWETWLRLFLRMLVIGLLLLGLADPSIGARPEVAGRDFLLIFDSSLSMRGTEQELSPFSRAREAAVRLIQSAPAGSTFRVLRNTGLAERVVVARPVSDRDALELELELLQPTYERGDWLGALQDATAVVQAGKAPVELHLFSDFQRSEWADSPRARRELLNQLNLLRQRVRVVGTDVGTECENRAIKEIRVSPAWVLKQESAQASVVVANYSPEPWSGIVSLRVNSLPAGYVPCELTPFESSTFTLPIPPLEPGEHLVEAAIEDDPLIEDNTGQVTLHVRNKLRLLLVEHASAEARYPPGRYLNHVFPGAGWPPPQPATSEYQLEIVPDLAAIELSPARYDVVLLANPGILSPRSQLELESFLRGGGGVLVGAGESLQQELAVGSSWWNRFLQARLLQLRESEAGGVPFHLRVAQPVAPLAAAFENQPLSGLETTRIHRYIQLQLPSEQWQNAVEYSSGDPAVAVRSEGLGRLVLITTTLDDGWGSWVAWPSFLPILREAVTDCISSKLQPRVLQIGQPLRVPRNAVPGGASLELMGEQSSEAGPAPFVLTPERRLLAGTLSADGEFWEFTGLVVPGVYTLQQGGEESRFCVRTDPRESNLERLNESLREELFPGGLNSPGPQRLSRPTVREGAFAQGWSSCLFWLAASCWLFEWRLTRWGWSWTTTISLGALIIGLLLFSQGWFA